MATTGKGLVVGESPFPFSALQVPTESGLAGNGSSASEGVTARGSMRALARPSWHPSVVEHRDAWLRDARVGRTVIHGPKRLR